MLISEWLQLDGWFVETGVPLDSKASGGRDEADVIAVKNIDGILTVLHVEVGSINTNAETNLEIIEKKFSDEKKIAIQSYVQNRIGENPEYKPRYIATYINNKSLDLIREHNFKIDRLQDVIQDEILPALKNWKYSIKGRKTAQLPTPPNNLWMIQLLDFMAFYEVDLKPFWKFKQK
jgi:hypothetical protein